MEVRYRKKNNNKNEGKKEKRKKKRKQSLFYEKQRAEKLGEYD